MKYIIFTLCLVMISVNSYARQPMKSLPPMQIVEQSGDTPYAITIKDSNGIRRFEIQHDGTLSGFNSSGSTIYSINSSGVMDYPLLNEQVTITATTGIGYAITGPSQGKTFLLGTDSTVNLQNAASTLGNLKAGTTVWVPGASGVSPSPLSATSATVLTPAMNGWEFTVVKNRSGTSEEVVWAGGLTFGASGTTPGAVSSTIFLNAQRDAVTLEAYCNSTSSSSGYYIKSYFIQ